MKILLVGSRGAAGMAVQEALAAEGRDVAWTRTVPTPRRGDEAALLILLPEGSPAELGVRCRALRSAFPAAELLALSRPTDDADALIDDGADDVLIWPEEVRGLGRRLRVALARVARRALLASESEEQLRAVIDSAADTIFIKDREGRYLRMSPHGAHLFGMEEDAIVGRTDTELFGETAGRQIREIDRRIMASGEPYTYEQTRTLHGRETIFFTTKYPWRSLTGEVRGVVGISRDITERRQLQLQAQLLMTDRLTTLDRLSAGLAHEINNPLQGVSASLELVRRMLSRSALMGEGSAMLERLLNKADEGCERIRSMVQALTTYARGPEPGTRGRDSELVDIHQVLDASLRLVHHALEHRARVICDYGEVPFLVGSAASLSQVFVNLLGNAAQALPPERPLVENEIRVMTRAGDGRVLVAIGDNGVGMAPEVVERIFEPFFTTKPAGEGTGIGLYLCRDVVSRLGGEIRVESEPGRGTVFQVWLPVIVAARAGRTTPAPTDE
ncbi:MAG TPA: ATP-binding protein [Polyangia bacterium]|jgi:PAS domain S-box-containing protein|nr:ATP-binding protein [Polyangia bacterium]